jgi:hypothetical protein
MQSLYYFELVFFYIGRGFYFSSKIEGIISGENRVTKLLSG